MRLLVDLGGTNTRCALFADSTNRLYCAHYENNKFAGFAGVIEKFLGDAARVQGQDVATALDCACAVASPESSDQITLVNGDWTFSQQALKKQFGFASLVCVNDFTANAMAITSLGQDQLCQIGGGNLSRAGTIGIFGPGTGLGTSALVRGNGQTIALPCEGGHVTLAAANDREADILASLRQQYNHVSAEKVLSGFGMVNLYRTISGEKEAAVEPKNIIAMAKNNDANASETLSLFFNFLGTFAADLALSLGAKGGIYLAGGILPKIKPELISSGFRQRFESKGRYSAYLADIPTLLVTEPVPAFDGLNAMLDKTVGSCAR